MFCPKCGRKIWEQEKFCVGCGEKLDDNDQSDYNTNRFNNNSGAESESDSYTYRKPYADPESFQNYQLEKRRLELEIRKLKFKERRYEFFKSDNFMRIVIGTLCLIGFLVGVIVLHNVESEKENISQSTDNTVYQDITQQLMKDIVLERFKK